MARRGRGGIGRWLLPGFLGLLSVGADAAPREVLLGTPASLWGVLEQAGVRLSPLEAIPFLDAFQRLNPAVTDIRRIPAGTRLRLPAAPEGVAQKVPLVRVSLAVRKAAAMVGAVRPAAPRPAPVPPPPVAAPPPPARLSFVIGKPGALPPLEPPEREVTLTALEGSLRGLFAALQEPYLASGHLDLSLGPETEIRINLDAIPLLTLAPDRRLLLDVPAALPPDVARLLEEQHPEMGVVSLGEGQGLAEAIQAVLARSRYYSVRRDTVVEIGDKARVTLRGDWVILQRDESLLTGQVNVVNLVRDPRLLIPEPIKTYAFRRGIWVSDLFVGRGEVPPTPAPFPTVPPPRALDASSRERLVDSLLELLGEVPERSVRLTVFEDPSAGVRVEATVSRLLRRPSGAIALDLAGIPEGVLRRLRQAGYRVVLLREEGPEETIRRLLDGLEVPYQEETFWRGFEPPKSNLRVLVPGFVLRLPGGGAGDGVRILLTRVPLDEDLARYLMSRRVAVARF
ncbi:MAG TPA: hypothetical protein VGT06_01570 [Candidatus Methylomirabilis sp.]|nr:hypothetical protein [Candidatus Methylomirabilis sp.]